MDECNSSLFRDKHVVILINYLRRHHVLTFREFSKRVGKLTILTSTKMEDDRPWEPEWDDLHVITQRNSTITLNKSAGYSEKNFIHLPWDSIGHLRKLKPDLIFSYEMGLRTLLCSAFRKFHTSIPLVMVGNMSMDLELRRGAIRKTFRRFLRKSVDLATYNGPSCKTYLQSIGFEESKMAYYPYCYDPEKSYTGPKSFSENGVKHVLFCGALAERKAIAPFSQMLRRYCDEHPKHQIEFRIAGDGPLLSQIESVGGGNLAVDIRGNCDKQHLRECFEWADLCMYPSFGDEWGLVPMEAWASGVPVLGSVRAQSIQTACRHGENGWMFDSKNEDDMYQSLTTALQTSSQTLRQMSVAARETAANFTAVHSAQYLYEAATKAVRLKSGAPAIDKTASATCLNKTFVPVGSVPDKPIATMSLDLDNKWAYLKSQGNTAWESFPSYLNSVVPTILSALDDFDLKITFFVVGQDAVISKNHEPLRMIAEAGHEIANHSFHHETCLHLYSPDRLEQEFQMAEKAIEDVTGRRTVGFRGPGFSLSDQTLEVLQRRGYLYDGTSFPTYLAPLARAYYIARCSLNKNRGRDKEALFGRMNDGFLPNSPYLWNSERGDLLEIPVTTFPVIKTPIHGTYLQYLASYSNLAASTYYYSALSALKLFGVAPSFLLHPLDFIGGDQEPELQFFPGMNVDSKTKLARMRNYLERFANTFDVMTMRQFAGTVTSHELGRKSTSLARSGASS